MTKEVFVEKYCTRRTLVSFERVKDGIYFHSSSYSHFLGNTVFSLQMDPTEEVNYSFSFTSLEVPGYDTRTLYVWRTESYRTHYGTSLPVRYCSSWYCKVCNSHSPELRHPTVVKLTPPRSNLFTLFSFLTTLFHVY